MEHLILSNFDKFDKNVRIYKEDCYQTIYYHSTKLLIYEFMVTQTIKMMIVNTIVKDLFEILDCR